MRRTGLTLHAGDFAENILTEGIDLKHLPVGTVLRVGKTRLQVTQIGKECHNDCEIRRLTGKCVMPTDGIFAIVLTGGTITAGRRDRGGKAMKCIKTEDAVGHVLCHDMTQIIPGVSKGPRFRKGATSSLRRTFRCCFRWVRSNFTSGRWSRVWCTKMTRQSGCVRSVRTPTCVEARQKRAKSRLSADD